MALVPPNEHDGREEGELRLVTGSGNEDVKLWSFSLGSPPKLKPTHTFISTPVSGAEATGGAVLSAVVGNGKTYAGFQDGIVRVWDLGTKEEVKCLLIKEASLHFALLR